MDKIVIYSRVSTDNQDNTSQIDDLKRYANYLMYDVVYVFEEQISGAIKGNKRPVFKSMLNFVLNKDNEIRFVMCWELSRFGRSNLDVLNNINLLKENNVHVILKKENINTSSTDPTSSLTLGILSSIAEFERHTIKDRTIRGLHFHLQNGGSHSIAPYGYKNLNKKIEIDENESIVVQRIYNMYANGTASPTIAKTLNIETIPTKKNKKWSDETIRGILQNTLYIGQRHYQIGVQPCPKIIDDELFYRVQTLFKDNAYMNQDKAVFPNYMKGKITCGCCGLSYYMHARKTRTDFAYKCLSHRKVTTGQLIKRCDNNAVNINLLNTFVFYTLLNIAKHLNNDESRNKYIQGVMNEINIQKDKLNSRLKIAKTELNKAEKRIESIEQKYIDGELSKVVYLNNIEKQKQIIEKISLQINDLNVEIFNLSGLNETRMTKTIPNFDNFQHQINTYINNVIVNKTSIDNYPLLSDIIKPLHYDRMSEVIVNSAFGSLVFVTVKGFNQFSYLIKDKQIAKQKGLKLFEYLLKNDEIGDKINVITPHQSVMI